MPANITRRPAGGYGRYTDDEAYIANAEAEFGRQEAIPTAGGWWLTTLGDSFLGHSEAAGVSFTANTQAFYPLGPRTASVRVAYARLRVLSAGAAGAVCRTALYFYDAAHQAFRKFPGTEALFAATGTGLLTKTLGAPVDVLPTTPLFVAFWTNDATVAVSGLLQAGSKVVGIRTLSAATTSPMSGFYPLATTTQETSTRGIPLVTYLSRDGNLVL